MRKLSFYRGLVNSAEVTSWQETEVKLAPNLKTHWARSTLPELHRAPHCLPDSSDNVRTPCLHPGLASTGTASLSSWDPPYTQAKARSLSQTPGGTGQFFLGLHKSTSFAHGIRGSRAKCSLSEFRSGRVSLGLDLWILKLCLRGPGRAGSWRNIGWIIEQKQQCFHLPNVSSQYYDYVLCWVVLLYPTFCHPMDCSQPGSSTV